MKEPTVTTVTPPEYTGKDFNAWVREVILKKEPIKPKINASDKGSEQQSTRPE